MDAIRRYACFEELAAIDGGEIEAHPALLAKLCGHLRSDLVAARADGGADGGVHIGGMRAETFAHGGQGRSGGTQSAVFTATTAPCVFSSRASPCPRMPRRPPAATQEAE